MTCSNTSIPQNIRVQAMAGGIPKQCPLNVEKRIRALGGTAVKGWQVLDCGGPTTTWSGHQVWRSPAGELVDVTPIWTDINGEWVTFEWPTSTSFIIDESAWDGDQLRPNRYVPKDPKNNKLLTACKYMQLADQKLMQGDHEGCRYWTHKANYLLPRAGYPGYYWDCPPSLDLADLIRIEASVANSDEMATKGKNASEAL